MGAFFIIPGNGYETSDGGPFYKDHNNQLTDTTQEIYVVMNSGHTKIEADRMGFHGPYILAFTDG